MIFYQQGYQLRVAYEPALERVAQRNHVVFSARDNKARRKVVRDAIDPVLCVYPKQEQGDTQALWESWWFPIRIWLVDERINQVFWNKCFLECYWLLWGIAGSPWKKSVSFYTFLLRSMRQTAITLSSSWGLFDVNINKDINSYVVFQREVENLKIVSNYGRHRGAKLNGSMTD